MEILTIERTKPLDVMWGRRSALARPPFIAPYHVVLLLNSGGYPPEKRYQLNDSIVWCSIGHVMSLARARNFLIFSKSVKAHGPFSTLSEIAECSRLQPAAEVPRVCIIMHIPHIRLRRALEIWNLPFQPDGDRT